MEQYYPSRLIQSLSLPNGGKSWSLNKVLTRESAEFFALVFSADMMGDAAFELSSKTGTHNKLVECFQDRAKLKFGSFDTEIVIDERGTKKTAKLYVMGFDGAMDYAKKFVQEELQEEPPRRKALPKFKEGLLASIGCDDECKVRGWFDLKNKFFVFADRDMFEKTKQKFEVRKEFSPAERSSASIA